MSDVSKPSAYALKSACACGAHASQAEHERAFTAVAASAADDEKLFTGFVERALLRAIAPDPLHRRALLRGVGSRLAFPSGRRD